MKKLYRSRNNSMVAGVCAGLGQYLSVDPTIVRLVFAMLAFYNLLGVWVYIVLAVVMPVAPEDFDESYQTFSLTENTQTVKVIGGGLILLGVLAFLSTLDFPLFAWLSLRNFWPALIVLLGVLLLVRGIASEE